ncbi:MAG TPA: hypothetical protein VEV84_09690, partial [Pyrinomonadaceae bacterium]|nr:hypothetical protein [Pyrinomonadaceae bacterium]
LRTVDLSNNDIEVRVWAGFGLTHLEGFTLKRLDGKWSALHIGYEFVSNNFKIRTSELAEPAGGWEAAWASLLKHQILTLPDARSIKCEAMFEDGFSYVVEVKKGPAYRTYMYDNPAEDFDNRCKEADEILAIASIIADDYRVPQIYPAGLRK